MTEAEWLAATDPTPMLEALRQVHALTDRKWRLFGVGCCSRITPLLTDERSRRAVGVGERYADGEATAIELDEAFENAFDVGAELANEMERDPTAFVTSGRDPLRYAAWAASNVAHPDESADGVASNVADTATRFKERPHQTALLRCQFGNPFRPVAVDPSWRTSAVVALAAGIYEERAFDRLPVLADALEDAGCGHADVLAHCRGDGPHARGCWVVDLILGKE